MPLAGTTVFAADGTAEVVLKNDSIDSGYRIDSLTVRVDGTVLGQTIGCACYEGFAGGQGGTLITESGNGALDHALGPYFLGPGKILTLVWQGGQVGQTATAFLTGAHENRDSESGVQGSLSFEVQAAGDLFIPSLFSFMGATPFRIRSTFTAATGATTAFNIPDFVPEDTVAWITHWSAGIQNLAQGANAIYLRVMEPGVSDPVAVGVWANEDEAVSARNMGKTAIMASTLPIGRVAAEALPTLSVMVDRTTVGGGDTAVRSIIAGVYLNLGGPSVGN
jgi:hypothetical protein